MNHGRATGVILPRRFPFVKQKKKKFHPAVIRRVVAKVAGNDSTPRQPSNGWPCARPTYPPSGLVGQACGFGGKLYTATGKCSAR